MRVRGGVHNVSLVPVPACVWLIGTLIGSIWSCPNRRQHQRANPKYQRLCFDLAPQQHDLNPTVSFESPTVTARRLENLTSAGLQHTSLYTLTGMHSEGNLKDNAMATLSLGRPPPKRATKCDAISNGLPFSILKTLIHKVFSVSAAGGLTTNTSVCFEARKQTTMRVPHVLPRRSTNVTSRYSCGNFDIVKFPIADGCSRVKNLSLMLQPGLSRTETVLILLMIIPLPLHAVSRV